MSRPTTRPDTVSTNVRLSRTLLDEVDALCAERLIGRALFIERAVKDLVQRLSKEEAIS